jgi:hypothetical protein
MAILLAYGFVPILIIYYFAKVVNRIEGKREKVSGRRREIAVYRWVDYVLFCPCRQKSTKRTPLKGVTHGASLEKPTT